VLREAEIMLQLDHPNVSLRLAPCSCLCKDSAAIVAVGLRLESPSPVWAMRAAMCSIILVHIVGGAVVVFA
jgi:hypothetical protein